MPRPPRPIVILGPTAGGKSELAVRLAEALRPAGGAEVVSADSMQVYRHLDAGTAKPEPELRARAPHHLLDVVEPTERFTVHDWLARAEPLVADLLARGVTPVVVGGTNLYLKAFLEGMFDAPGPGQDPAFRAALDQTPSDELRRRLVAIDPAAAERIHPNDRRRTIRALEVFHLTGRPITALQTQWEGSPGPASDAPPHAYRHDPILLGLDWPAEAVNRRINERVRRMFHPQAFGSTAEPLPDETRRLEAAGLLGPQAREALGYKQVLQALRGEATMDEAFERTKIESRRYAKQQRTWLKRYRGVRWLPASTLPPDGLTEAALRAIAAGGAAE